MYKLLFFAVLALLFAQCKPILKKVYGITKPKIENEESLQKFLRKMHIQNQEIYTTKNLEQFAALHSETGLPNAFFFNQQGFYIDYRETPESCNAGIKNFIGDLKAYSASRLDSSQLIQPHLSRILDNKLQPVTFEQLPKTEFYVLIYWAKFAGKTNSKVLDWEKAIAEGRAKGLSITALYINGDYQKHWGISKKDLPKFKY